MKTRLQTHDLALITIDTLRYDTAHHQERQGNTPTLTKAITAWQKRHTPASFTYAAHHAFFAGFLPTPTTGSPHHRLYAAAFPGATSTTSDTWTFDAPDVVTALAHAGYHTLCLGGVGFFNRLSPLGSVLPDLFAEAHWRPEFGVTEPDSLTHQLDQLAASIGALEPATPLFTFLNVSAVHQPNHHYLPGATRDTLDSHAAALTYVDSRMARLFALLTSRCRPCFVIICADHGTAYGEDGHHGHRVGHDVVWTVPYADFTLREGEW